MSDYFLSSSRLGFRHWDETDLPLAIGLWGDPAVTRYIAARGYTVREVQIRLELEIEAQQTHGIQYWPFFPSCDRRACGLNSACMSRRGTGDRAMLSRRPLLSSSMRSLSVGSGRSSPAITRRMSRLVGSWNGCALSIRTTSSMLPRDSSIHPICSPTR